MTDAETGPFSSSQQVTVEGAAWRGDEAGNSRVCIAKRRLNLILWLPGRERHCHAPPRTSIGSCFIPPLSFNQLGRNPFKPQWCSLRTGQCCRIRWLECMSEVVLTPVCAAACADALHIGREEVCPCDSTGAPDHQSTSSWVVQCTVLSVSQIALEMWWWSLEINPWVSTVAAWQSQQRLALMMLIVQPSIYLDPPTASKWLMDRELTCNT